jgi:uncharacterized membrane protein YhaH (DUF805 family)
MESNQPFSFSGRIGRMRLWLTLIIAGVINIVSEVIFPVSEHYISSSSLGNFGGFAVRYATPIEPMTIRGWIVLGTFYLFQIAITWVFAAAIVKRLHDRGQSGVWLAVFFGAFVAIIIPQAVSPFFGIPTLAVDIVTLIIFIPVGILGIWGTFSLLFLRARNGFG